MSDAPTTDDEHVAVLGRLRAACASDTNASLMAAHMSLSCAGRLRSASQDGVVVEVPNPPTSDVTLLGSTAAVSFPVGTMVAGFVAEIVGVKLDPAGSLLATVALPAALQLNDRRSAVRIPVPRATLTATIVDDQSRYPARAVDISLTGILLEFDTRVPDPVAVGRSVALTLALGEHTVAVEADVCRRDRNRFGLRYRSDDGPPKGLARVIYELQAARRPAR